MDNPAGDSARRYPIHEQLSEARRELALRKAVYPGFVQRGKLSQRDADRQIALMAEIVRTLETLRPHDLFGQ